MLVTLSLVVLLVASIWLYNRHRFSYWAKRGIPSPPTTPLLGHLSKIGSNKQGRWVFENEVYHKYNKNGLSGVYNLWDPILYVCDPELLRSIFVKDFDHFSDRRTFKSPSKSDQVINATLSNENGDTWKTLRSIMTPSFTSGKMRNMFHIVCEKADALVTFSLAQAQKKPFVNMKYNFGRFTIDTIASCAFGLECNSLTDENAVFPKKADPFFEFGAARLMKFLAVNILPAFVFRALNLKLFPEETQFFKIVAEETLAARRKGVRRGDFLDLLLEAQASEKNLDKSGRPAVDDTTIIAQCVSFILAGYDTTATTIAFATHLLAKNLETQQRLRQELQNVIKENDGMTYQGIMEAKYLDACLQETLRIYPVAPILERQCSKDFHFRIADTNLLVKRNQIIQVPVWALHHDEKYWPDPEAFFPDRFLPENKENITQYTYMPFGLGPRNCIGMRFALMEAKVVLAKLVLATEMKPAPGHEELVLSTGFALLKTDNVNLIFNPLKEE